MNTYIAFLRAINVSGYRIIKMEDLRKIFISMDLQNIRTYIQSGNVIFNTNGKNAGTLRKKIEKHLFDQLGYEVVTLIRSADDIKKIILNNPFKDYQLSRELKLYVSFLSSEPEIEFKEVLLSFNNDIEEYHLTNNNLYCLIVKNSGKPNFSNMFIEKKLKVSATTRDWNTILKIRELISQ